MRLCVTSILLFLAFALYGQNTEHRATMVMYTDTTPHDIQIIDSLPHSDIIIDTEQGDLYIYQHASSTWEKVGGSGGAVQIISIDSVNRVFTITLSDGGGSVSFQDTRLTPGEVMQIAQDSGFIQFGDTTAIIATKAWVNAQGYITAEVDGDVTNELQTLSFTSPTLSISDGNNVDLSALNTDDQTLSLVGNELSIEDGNMVTLPSSGGGGVDTFINGLSFNTGTGDLSASRNFGADVVGNLDGRYLQSEVDGSISNELQDLSWNDGTNTIQITGGNDAIITGFLESEVDGSVTNELQTLSIAGWDLSITNGNTITLPQQDLSGYLDWSDTSTLATQWFVQDQGFITNPDDADADPTNEIQTLSLTGDDLSISGGNSVTITHPPEVDGDTTNELQTLSIDSTAGRSFTITLSDGNSVSFKDQSGGGGGSDTTAYISGWLTSGDYSNNGLIYNTITAIRDISAANVGNFTEFTVTYAGDYEINITAGAYAGTGFTVEYLRYYINGSVQSHDAETWVNNQTARELNLNLIVSLDAGDVLKFQSNFGGTVSQAHSSVTIKRM